MRKLLQITLLFIVLATTGCLKDTPATDLSHEGTIIEMIYPGGAQNNGVGTGLQYFGGGALTFPSSDASDTVTYMVNIAGTNTLPTSLAVTIALDPSATQDNFSNDSITYVAFPDSDYSILSTTANIPAGSRLATFQVVFYPSKFDPTQNFMLPLTVTTNPSYTISGNFGIMYLHTIGNPLAGNYNDVSATRYNYNAQSSLSYSYPGPYPPYTGTLDLTPYFPKTAAPSSPTELKIPYANNLGNYIVDFDPVTLAVTSLTTDVSGITNFTVYLASYNPATKTFHFITSYYNATPNPRIVDETMVHQ